ncbi:MAG: beta-lactamase family protein [Bacteroidales bacterium]|nr:beta-lactamase family protein [Bacteroidales bacterium]
MKRVYFIYILLITIIVLFAKYKVINKNNKKFIVTIKEKTKENNISNFISLNFYRKIFYKKIDDFFTKSFNSWRCGGVVFLAYKDVPLYVKSFGYNNSKKREKINTSYFFQIGSITKHFTAVAILKLAEEKKLNLDDPVQKYLPYFPFSNITIRMLLTHTSGLENYQYIIEEKAESKNKPFTNDDLIAYIIKYKHNFYNKPGKKFIYSNTGYAILAKIIEVVSNQNFKNYLINNFFSKYNLKFFFYDDIFNKNDFHDKIAIPYKVYYNTTQFDYFLNTINGDKGIFANIYDLYKWDTLLFRYHLLSKKFTDTLFNGYTLTRNKITKYGFGWRITELKNGENKKIIFHSGWWQGYQSLLLNIPDDSLVLIVLKNKFTGKAVIDFRRFFNIFYNQMKNIKRPYKIETNILEQE